VAAIEHELLGAKPGLARFVCCQLMKCSLGSIRSE